MNIVDRSIRKTFAEKRFLTDQSYQETIEREFLRYYTNKRE